MVENEIGGWEEMSWDWGRPSFDVRVGFRCLGLGAAEEGDREVMTSDDCNAIRLGD